MRIIIAALCTLIVGVASSSLAKTDLPPKASELKEMNETEVRALLTDVEIGPECCDMAEVFYRDGTYVYLGIGPYRGHYTVSGNYVCVTTEWHPAATCRRFYWDRNRKPVAILNGEVHADPVQPRPAPDKPHWR